MHGGVSKDALDAENLPALKAGFANLARHVANMHNFGVPIIVAINRFASDTETELDLITNAVRDRLRVKSFVCDHWTRGGVGCEDLAHGVAALADGGSARFRPLYPDAMSLWEKTRTIAREIYGAADVAAETSVRAVFRELEADGWGRLPICVAKTPYSFSDNPALLGAPTGHVPTIAGVRLRAGAGYVVVLMGDVRTMPGLPRSSGGGKNSGRRTAKSRVCFERWPRHSRSSWRRRVLANQLFRLSMPAKARPELWRSSWLRCGSLRLRAARLR